MKKFSFLIFGIILVCCSCKKTEYVQFRFVCGGALPFDSIDYCVVNYSEISELSQREINNPEVYSHSATLDPRQEYITLIKGNTYVFKKYELIGKSGEIMFYVPYEGQPGSDKVRLKMPRTINVFENMNYAIDVVRYKESR